jgi:hypothetical protein
MKITACLQSNEELITIISTLVRLTQYVVADGILYFIDRFY